MMICFYFSFCIWVSSRAVQWEQNSGNCGVCGDAYNVRSPRPHEAGGEYAKGIISRFYTAGQVIELMNNI